ncbi:TetR/AcrR family transcriptional regulator [Actinopolymorpha pittospori]
MTGPSRQVEHKRGSTTLRADARRNRASVLAAAEEAFAAEGLSVPLDEIARRAGVGAGTVYRHFPTKEALFETVVSERLAQLGEDAKGYAEADDPGAAFFALFAEVVERARLNKALCEALEASTGVGFTGDSRARREFQDVFGELLGRAQRAGAVRRDVDIETVQALLRGCVSMEAQRHRQGSGGQVVAIVCDGLRPDRATSRSGSQS